MKTKNTNTVVEEIKLNAEEKKLAKAMDNLFAKGGWTIPDDAIVGIYAKKVDQLQAQVTSLTQLLGQLSAKIEGKPVTASGRVDAIAATKVEKKK
jgi:hypothetical protein